MKSTLHLKFLILYIVFAFLSLFTVNAMFPSLVSNQLYEATADTLYQQATLTASDYLPDYFSNKLNQSDVTKQLQGMSAYSDSSVWLVDQGGKVLAYSKSESTEIIPLKIRDFNPAESGSSNYLVGDYHKYFGKKVITVIAPITHNWSTKGYLMIHKSCDDLRDAEAAMMKNIYILLLVVFFFSFILLLGIHFIIYRPLTKITDAAKQYASGNLDVVIPIDSEDELGYLSASLNYMSSQLKDMEDYQKKFIGNVSHDFRSPLTSIKGYVEAIADGTIPPEFQDKYLKIILFETERLTDLTQDLLTLNEFDTKNLLLDKTHFNVHEMIRNTAASFEGTCTTKKISIELLFATRNLDVFADARKIQQVLYNLIDNAIKFSETDSTVTIETTERADKVFISIKDNGIGIPRKSLNKIWERFYKSDLSRGKDKKGTGLGLAIVKEIIQAHNEKINVISTEGVGTEFVFSLPKN